MTYLCTETPPCRPRKADIAAARPDGSCGSSLPSCSAALSAESRLNIERAPGFGGREVRRVEILRLRFEKGLPVREIQEQLEMTPELAHKEYARARKSYRAVLEDVVAAHYPGARDDLAEMCREVMRLLG